MGIATSSLTLNRALSIATCAINIQSTGHRAFDNSFNDMVQRKRDVDQSEECDQAGKQPCRSQFSFISIKFNSTTRATSSTYTIKRHLMYTECKTIQQCLLNYSNVGFLFKVILIPKKTEH